MDEREWVMCKNVTAMLQFLRGKQSARKRCLFICALCRLNWRWLYHDSTRECVDFLERYVDGQGTEEEKKDVLWSAEVPCITYDCDPSNYFGCPGDPREQCLYFDRLLDLALFIEQDIRAGRDRRNDDAYGRIVAAKYLPFFAAFGSELEDELDISRIELLNGPKCQMLRCLYGPALFRRPNFNCAWISATVKALAQTFYESRASRVLPILSDALIDAGCTDADMIEHCQHGKWHVRGCWVVDLVLGKE